MSVKWKVDYTNGDSVIDPVSVTILKNGVFPLIMSLPQWIDGDDAMIIFTTSIYHLYHPWYFTTIYVKAVGKCITFARK